MSCYGGKFLQNHHVLRFCCLFVPFSPGVTPCYQFAKHQEKVRKDAECAFGVLVQRCHILKRPLRGWCLEDLQDLIHACAILHTMTVVERFGTTGDETADENLEGSRVCLSGRNPTNAADATADGIDLFAARVAAFENAMQSDNEHFPLKRDLVEHMNNFYE